MVEKRKKVRFNWIDALIVIFILAVIAAAAYFLVDSFNPKENQGTEDFKVEIRIENVKKESFSIKSAFSALATLRQTSRRAHFGLLGAGRVFALSPRTLTSVDSPFRSGVSPPSRRGNAGCPTAPSIRTEIDSESSGALSPISFERGPSSTSTGVARG